MLSDFYWRFLFIVCWDGFTSMKEECLRILHVLPHPWISFWLPLESINAITHSNFYTKQLWIYLPNSYPFWCLSFWIRIQIRFRSLSQTPLQSRKSGISKVMEPWCSHKMSNIWTFSQLSVIIINMQGNMGEPEERSGSINEKITIKNSSLVPTRWG